MNHLHITNLWINSLMQAFAQIGLDSADLIAGFKGFKDGLLQEEQPLELQAARTLWHRAEALSGDPLLGFTVGAIQNFRSTGVLMPICWHSPNALQALQHIASFQKLISENGLYRMVENATTQTVDCEYIPSANVIPANLQQILSVIVGTVLLLREITGNKLNVDSLTVPPEINAQRLSDALQYPVINHTGNFKLTLGKQSLMHPIVGRDEYLYQINLAYAEGMLRSQQEHQTLIDQVKKCIDVNQPALIQMTTVASVLNMSPRVIQRHLLEQQTSFRELKEIVLKKRSIECLVSRNLNASVAAQLLGYSETSAFYRAFKGWFGVTPGQFQQQKITPQD